MFSSGAAAQRNMPSTAKEKNNVLGLHRTPRLVYSVASYSDMFLSGLIMMGFIWSRLPPDRDIKERDDPAQIMCP